MIAIMRTRPTRIPAAAGPRPAAAPCAQQFFAKAKKQPLI